VSQLQIRNIGQLFVGKGQVLTGQALAIDHGRVSYLGAEGGLTARGDVIDAGGGLVSPGLVDAHTHLVFAGDRADEFAQRCAGATYLEIAQKGGGILSTVRATQLASEKELVELALPRLAALLAQGVTTAEVKSGYGLTVDDELKMLRVIRRLQGLQPISLVPTLLALHAVPQGVDRSAWVRTVLTELLPRVAQDKLAVFCDVFVEQSAFTADEAREVLRAARALGLLPRLHVDQLTPGKGAELAAELSAVTADHLEHASDAGMRALGAAGTVAVLAPISTLYLRQRPFANGRKLRDAGVSVALCTNCNPGSAMTENVALAMGLACLECGLTPLEALEAFTGNAAHALRVQHAGHLRLGDPADVVIFKAKSPAHLVWHLGQSEVRAVLKAGKLVHGG